MRRPTRPEPEPGKWPGEEGPPFGQCCRGFDITGGVRLLPAQSQIMVSLRDLIVDVSGRCPLMHLDPLRSVSLVMHTSN